MPGLVPFTDNFHDLSNTEGYQFEFYCERCGNGYRSPFQRDKVEMGRGLLRVVGSLFGGAAEDISRSAEQWRYDRATNSPAKDRALGTAVEQVRDNFRQCRGCGDWMCAALCWNDEIGQCLRCSPVLAEEIARAQAEAQVQQVRQKAYETDWTANVDMSTRAKLNCPSCKAKVDGGKFCSACGSPMAVPVPCGGCGSQNNKLGAVFCSDCGSRL
ncbi:DNA-directed RNA polymerase subunit RPC12/RpoP [Kutzneria viridogrisea]|uniref:DNA-directed RNA polymerase subunit RPC12/RpoP n=1 Tax=Kutzneria viridogrisea TaxID=47990 RepID=A0ABR6BQG9_9PSEU|nr:zinc ribbon domain-containing protein [Kutzneria albida]MBA8929157.1 DNA-directed RNA polymerase subunit RPC12/RpoP [Kutzneria viridogrisea]